MLVLFFESARIILRRCHLLHVLVDICGIPYFLGLLAALDPSGGLAAFSVAIADVRSGSWPGQLSAIIVGIATYSATIYACIAFVVIALLVM